MSHSRKLKLFRVAAIAVAVLWGVVECVALCRSRLVSGASPRPH
jgi:hypothetical protein